MGAGALGKLQKMMMKFGLSSQHALGPDDLKTFL